MKYAPFLATLSAAFLISAQANAECKVVLQNTSFLSGNAEPDISAETFTTQLQDLGFEIVPSRDPADALVNTYPLGTKSIVVKKSQNPYDGDLKRTVYLMRAYVKVGDKAAWVRMNTNDQKPISDMLTSMGCKP